MRMADLRAESIQQSGTVLLHEYWSMALRRKWVIIGSIVLSLAAAGVVCKVSPKWYRSETLIFVEEQKIPENYVRGLVVEGSLEQRIFAIQKQITSRKLIGEVVKEFSLYPDDVATRGLDATIPKVAAAVRLDLVSKPPSGVPRSSLDAFTISFSHGDPETAMRVTARLASKFIEENARAREQIAEGTTEFLNYEVMTAKRELEMKEDQISRFKSTHMAELPQQMEANLRALDRLQTDLKMLNETTPRLRDRLALVEKAIQEYERFGSTNAALAGSARPDQLYSRLEELRKRLTALLAEFTESYPDTVLTKEEIRQVEGELVALYGPEAIKLGEKRLDPYLHELKKQQSEVKGELASLGQRQHSLNAERKEYLKRVENAPAVEQELLILERDYDNMKNNYRSLLDKRINARVSENLEKRQQGSQYRIIDPANFPRVPDKPNQPLIMILGLMFGCAMGGGIAVMQEQLNPQFRRPEDIEHLLGPQLLAVIPDFMRTENRMNWHRLLPNYQVPQGTNGHSDVRQATAMRRLPWRGEGRVPLDMNFIAKWQPASIAAEQYRVAATRLALAKSQDRCAVIAVTSAVKGEGKTTTVMNLGYTLARDLGKQTLLIDCDLKCPVLHHYALTPPEHGLADCLTNDVSIDACITNFGEVPCAIMPVGNAIIPSNELLKTDRLAAILHRLRQDFDYILINTPPILPLADMNVLAGHADAVLLVVRAGSTPQQFVRRAVSTLPPDMPIHVILNAVGSLPTYMSDYGYALRP